MRSVRPRAEAIAGYAGLLALVLVALLPATRAPFTVDDGYVLPRAAADEPAVFLRAWNIDVPSPLKGAWYDGVTFQRRYVRVPPSALMALEVRLFGPDPTAIHTVSLALHAMNVLLLFALLRSWLGRPLPAALGSTAFGLHPASVEVVAAANSLPLMVVAACLLGSVFMLRRFRRHGGHWPLAAFAAAVLAALTSYEAAVLAPLVVVAVDWVLARRGGARGLRLAGPAIAVALVIAVTATMSWINRRGVTAPDTTYRPTLSELAFVARTDLENYLLKTVGVLNPFDLEEYWAHNTVGPVGVALMLVVVGAGVVTLLRRHPPARAGVALYFALLLPPYLLRATVSLMNYPTLRQLYLPMLGAAIAVAASLRSTASRPVAVGVALLLPALLAMDWTLARNGLVGTSVHMERMRRMPGIVRAALAEMPSEAPVALVGKFDSAQRGCDFALPLVELDRRAWSLVPPTSGGEEPALHRTGGRTFEASAASGFRIPLQTVFPQRAGPADEIWPTVRLTRRPPPLVAAGSQRLDGASVEVLDRDAGAIRRLRVTLDRPIDDFVFLWVDGCEAARAVRGSELR